MNKIINTMRKEALATIGLYKPFITRKKNRRQPPIHLFWWSDPSNNLYNFGDEITQDIISHLFGYHVHWSTVDSCDMIGAGSLLEYVEARCNTNEIKVWGSGYIQKGDKNKNNNFDFFAVRGKRTLKRIEEKERKIPLGDPGLLTSLIYPKEKTDGRIGIIPHYVDLNSTYIKKIKKDKRYKIISPLQPPKQVAKQLSSCSIILSSSLHGLILADSYRIPNAHIVFSDKVIGGDYKFKDYCSGVDKEYLSFNKNDIKNIEKIYAIKSKYKPIRYLRKIQRRLIKSFPYQ